MSIILVFLDIHTYLNKGNCLNLVIKRYTKNWWNFCFVWNRFLKYRSTNVFHLSVLLPRLGPPPCLTWGVHGRPVPGGMSRPHRRADRQEPRSLQPTVSIPAPQQPSQALWSNKKAWWIKFYFAFGTQGKRCLKNVKYKNFCENTNFIDILQKRSHN